MGEIVRLDPLTRIEGHLAFKVETENGLVGRAFLSGEMFPTDPLALPAGLTKTP